MSHVIAPSRGYLCSVDLCLEPSLPFCACSDPFFSTYRIRFRCFYLHGAFFYFVFLLSCGNVPTCISSVCLLHSKKI